ncbi:electron transfer flavoprotein beta subunit/FixA family protein [Trueperella pyogenes]|uniref:Electron transfer flavoprotein small subunit n=1 Tax=Trueperella pyogenes TaxID=1661 RepID=A0ABV3NA15_9ACTO|nr:electron transfer flavoprotein subunit alpha [Trueperella pyogenes]AWA44460.1 electron transfer flavoprotein subunit alpha [Trueperella pyogenes]AZR03739.1 electron transfer flavoprotein beta subunit/FixA family protein [Trueperella pyogenes]
MSIVVAYKYAPNPQDAKVLADGAIDWSRAKAAVSESDPVAMEMGRRIATAVGTELVGISVGNAQIASPIARKNAMSRGFDRGILLADDVVADWSATQVGAALAELVKKVGDVSLVLTADSSVDEAAGVTPALIAGYLGWPAILDVTRVEPTEGGYLLTQRIKGGTRTLKVTGRAVVATTSDATSPAVPSMKDILAAGKKPVEVLGAADVEASGVALNVVGRERPAKREREGKMYGTAAELVAALREDGVL